MTDTWETLASEVLALAHRIKVLGQETKEPTPIETVLVAPTSPVQHGLTRSWPKPFDIESQKDYAERCARLVDPVTHLPYLPMELLSQVPPMNMAAYMPEALDRLVYPGDWS